MSEPSLRERINGLTAAQKAFYEMVPPLSSEPFSGETLIADGWTYYDLPPLTPAQMETFLEVVSDANMRWISLARTKAGIRGQMFLSPVGKRALQNYLEATN
jgi:hypothetical protein